MTHLALRLLEGLNLNGQAGVFMFLSVGAISLFGIFLPVAIVMETRRKEREAYYKADIMRRVTESSGEGSKAVLELMREESRQKQIKTIEALKIAGLINVGVGIALVIFLRSLLGSAAASPYLCGLIPGFIGVAMLVYVYAMARPVE